LRQKWKRRAEPAGVELKQFRQLRRRVWYGLKTECGVRAVEDRDARVLSGRGELEREMRDPRAHPILRPQLCGAIAHECGRAHIGQRAGERVTNFATRCSRLPAGIAEPGYSECERWQHRFLKRRPDADE
jgi:hypothetical protein